MEEFIVRGENTPRNIPACKFIEKIETFVKDRNIQPLQENLKELLIKYKYMNQNIEIQTQNQNSRIPDIKDALQAVKLLQDRKNQTFEAHYNLADVAYAKARIPPTDVAYLWLGANTMVEYTLEEAEAVLEKNLKIAEQSVQKNMEDLDWLRTQIVIAEVNIARLHNYSVLERQKKGES